MEPVIVIGAGLAGSEAAWQLAQRGIPVELHEMKPEKMTPAHHSGDFGELVCSNSLRSDQLENAVGLLKEELRRCGSLIMACADAHRVEAGEPWRWTATPSPPPSRKKSAATPTSRWWRGRCWTSRRRET